MAISVWPDVLGYIDPGSASAMFTILGPLIAGIVAVLGVILWPFRWVFINIVKKVFPNTKVAIGVLVGVPVVALAAVGAYSMLKPQTNDVGLAVGESRFDKVIMLGMDGLEPTIVEQMMDAGELPNFTKLREQGYYARMTTSNPPESPVAWSCIATGRNPGKHGIFDFIHRDPKRYIPYLSITLPNPKNYTNKRSNAFLNAVKTEPFWRYASHEFPVTVIRWPGVFPPDKVSGTFYSGLGTPDVKGRQGAYTFYTTNPEVFKPSGRKNAVQVQWDGDTFTSQLEGPTVQGLTGKSVKTVPVVVKKTASPDTLSVQVASAAPIDVRVGTWSDFVPVSFKLGALQGSVAGMVKFYLTAIEPDLKLYASPVQMDPKDPAYPFTEPNAFAGELADAIGTYHTLGMPEIVHALSDDCYGPDAFLAECQQVTEEREKMLDYELERFHSGLLAFVFDTSDRLQHMFWVTRDDKHPLYTSEFAAKYGHVIPDMYRDMDRMLGKVLAKVDDKTALFVLSDHGFNTFRRAVSLNTWFIDNGYMTLKGDQKYNEDAMSAKAIDWSRTKAFAVGFASVYFNVKGREAQGIVDPKDVPALIQEIGGKLLDLRDPKNNERVVRNVYAGREVYRGPETENGPDMIVGFEAGYRGGWAMAVGGSAPEVFEDNMNQWCGDHLMDFHLVPGILFSNVKLADVQPRLIDIAPTILKCLGAKELPSDMDGESLYKP